MHADFAGLCCWFALAQCRHLHCEHGIAFARRCVVGLVRLRTGSARRPTTKAPLASAGSLGPPLFPAVSTPPNKRRKGVQNKSPCSSHGHSALDAHTAASTTLSRGHARGFWLASFDVRLLISCNWAELEAESQGAFQPRARQRPGRVVGERRAWSALGVARTSSPKARAAAVAPAKDSSSTDCAAAVR